jgi:2-(1,2-epoxy-1,2-dihydrophenyl)acetyl-CoA isomerase
MRYREPCYPYRRRNRLTFTRCYLSHPPPCICGRAVRAGAGLGWALACDLRFAAESAGFNVAFLDVGVAGDMGGPMEPFANRRFSTCPRTLFPGGQVDAAEALRIGLVARIFPDDRFQVEVDAIVNRLSDCAPIALRTLKANSVDSETDGLCGVRCARNRTPLQDVRNRRHSRGIRD